MSRISTTTGKNEGRGSPPSFFVLPVSGAALLVAGLLLALAPAAPRAATLDPESEDAFNWLPPPGPGAQKEILALIESGQPDQAIARLRAEIAAGRDGAVVQELLGIAHARLGEIERSLAAFEAAVALDPRSPSAHTNMALVLQAIGRTEAAEALFRKAIELDPDDRRAHQNLGLIAQARGDTAAAIAHFEAGIRGTPPGYLGVKLDLARLYLARGRAGDVLALLGNRAEDPRAPESVAVLLARAHMALGEIERARALLAPHLENPRSPAPLIQLARIAMAERDFATAEALLARADAAFPGNAQIAFERGNLNGARRRYEEALAFYEEGLRRAPRNPDLLHAAALASYRLARPEQALALARKALSADPGNTGTLFLIATISERLGKEEEAIAAYEKALALAPESWLFRNNLAALLTPRDPARAVALARQAAAGAPEGNADVRDTLGWALFHAGETAEARAIFERLTRENPDDAKALFRLGTILMAAGARDEAEEALTRALALAPEAPFAPQARKALATPRAQSH